MTLQTAEAPMETEVVNAVIEKIFIGYEANGILIAYLDLKKESGYNQGTGAYDLRHSDACANFIIGCMKVCGVNRWEDCKGKVIRV